MQNTLFQNFENEIQNIQKYIEHLKLIDEIAKNSSSSNEELFKAFNIHLATFNVDKKVFEYKSIIISLYGILEKYISIWLKDHISNINQLLPTYDKLPLKIQEEHFRLSIKLISLLSENKFSKYEMLDKEKILLNLASCFNTSNYQLNTDAFLPLSGNLKHQKIVEAFKSIDINLTDQLKRNETLLPLLEEKYGSQIEKKHNDILFLLIDDLVTRRNDIAHGSEIDDLLEIDRFSDYIKFLKIYGKAIFEVLIEKEISYEVSHYEEMDIIDIFRNSILCFTLENHIIKKGDYIIIKKFNGNFFKKIILDIQIDNKSFDKKEILSATNIGINLGGELKQNQKFYLKRRIYKNKSKPFKQKTTH